MKTILCLILVSAMTCAANPTNTNTPPNTITNQSVVVCIFALSAVAAGGLAIIYVTSHCPDCKEHCWMLQRSTDEESWSNISTNTFSVCNGNSTNIFSGTITGKKNFYRLKRCD